MEFTQKIKNGSWLVWLSGRMLACESKDHQLNSESKAHAWVASQVPSRGHMRGKHTLMFLSFCFSLPSLL